MNNKEYLARLQKDYPDLIVMDGGYCSFWMRNKKGDMLEIYTSYTVSEGTPDITGVKSIAYNCYKEPDLGKFIKLLREV